MPYITHTRIGTFDSDEISTWGVSMRNRSIIVRAEWDDEAKVWVATSADIAGLAVEAATQDELQRKVRAALEDLIELNGFDSDLPEIPVHVMSEQLIRVSNAC